MVKKIPEPTRLQSKADKYQTIYLNNRNLDSIQIGEFMGKKVQPQPPVAPAPKPKKGPKGK